jgi:hypothetical protein
VFSQGCSSLPGNATVCERGFSGADGTLSMYLFTSSELRPDSTFNFTPINYIQQY